MGRKRKCDCPDECRSPSGRCNVHRADQGPEYYQTIKEKESERYKRKRERDPDLGKKQYERYSNRPDVLAERSIRLTRQIEERARKEVEKLERILRNKEKGRLRRRKCSCPEEGRDSRGRCISCKLKRTSEKYHSDPAVRQKSLDKWQEFISDPKNKESHRMRNRLYHYLHPEKGREKENRRRERIRIAGGDLSPSDISRLRQQAKESACCEDCGSRDKIHVSHRIPVVLGGPYSSWNIFFLCEECNLKLGSKIHHSVADVAATYAERGSSDA